MKDVTNANFGLLIAYVLPGSVALWGASLVSETLRTWLGSSSAQGPSVGGFLYVTLAAVGLGLFISTIRWAVIDQVHHHTGIPEPKWNFAKVNGSLAGFDLLVTSHYRYYQFYANGLISVGMTWAAFLVTAPHAEIQVPTATAGALFIEVILWLGSRDTLRKYYLRAEALMS